MAAASSSTTSCSAWSWTRTPRACRSARTTAKCRWRLLESTVMEQARAPAYRLVRRPVPAAPAARLDEAQQAVVDHPGGPLLVLAGPGTGKTTTIVAAVADRIERRGLDPERVLVLTFSRKAAAELRERITARLRR